ncbi:hypothetical protein NDU88_004440 [Pleurodeles waltl]|uniref:Uncharacterized protein n=1 Tax=Pleurodeles waltl TaxID=8319 RepID=A0AAV7RJM0_PLEWA|nr:hypothetical protein NDU88_004440 [Pleurodeles waltl]
MGVLILLSDPIGLICGPPDRLPEYASLVPIKLSRRGGSSRPRPAGPSSGGTISVLVRGAPHHASSPCGTRIGPRQSSCRSPGGHQRSSTSHLQLAARSFSLTRSHSLALGSPHLCLTLLVLRNSGPAQLEPSRWASLCRSQQPGRRPPGAIRGVPRLCRSKQHVASASPGGTHWHPALRISAQLSSCFVTLVRPSRALPGRLPSTGLRILVVAPPEATRGVPCPSRIKQHVASALAALGVTHCRSALLFSAQRCSRFVTPDRPSPGPHTRRVQVTRVHHCSSSIRSGGLGGQPGSALSRSYPRLREDAEFYWVPLASLRREPPKEPRVSSAASNT